MSSSIHLEPEGLPLSLQYRVEVEDGTAMLPSGKLAGTKSSGGESVGVTVSRACGAALRSSALECLTDWLKTTALALTLIQMGELAHQQLMLAIATHPRHRAIRLGEVTGGTPVLSFIYGASQG